MRMQRSHSHACFSSVFSEKHRVLQDPGAPSRGVGNVWGLWHHLEKPYFYFPLLFSLSCSGQSMVQLQLCSKKSKSDYKNKSPKEWQPWKGISEQGTTHSQTHLGSGIIKLSLGTGYFFRSSGYFSWKSLRVSSQPPKKSPLEEDQLCPVQPQTRLVCIKSSLEETPVKPSL